MRFAAKGAAVVVTTHFMEEAEYCDRFLIQDAGKIIAIGSPSEIREAAYGKEKAEGASIESAFIEIVEKKRLEREKGGAA